MKTIQMETDIKSEYIKVPQYKKIKNKHARVFFIFDEEPEKEKNRKSPFLEILNNGPKVSFLNDEITREWIHESENKADDDLYR